MKLHLEADIGDQAENAELDEMDKQVQSTKGRPANVVFKLKAVEPTSLLQLGIRAFSDEFAGLVPENTFEQARSKDTDNDANNFVPFSHKKRGTSIVLPGQRTRQTLLSEVDKEIWEHAFDFRLADKDVCYDKVFVKLNLHCDFSSSLNRALREVSSLPRGSLEQTVA
mmetsp:Transcript_10121/g.8874  ORF Transcript_10121/g.8874 Transcript_10121/m.8874 type:complete len:168 (+) Transcript_10121:1994-2497(+)